MRLNATADPRVQQKVLLPELIDQLFANVLWAVVVSFVVTALVLVVTAAPPLDKHGDAVPFPLWLTIALIVLGTHLFAVVWMCVRRLRAAYREMRS